MAYLVDSTVQTSTTGAANVALTFPPHQANDIIVVHWTQDAVTTANVNVTGWLPISAEQSAGADLTSRVFWKRATSNAESANITITAADAYVIRSFVVRDVDTVTAIDSSTNNSNTTIVSQFQSEALTTTTNDCFILYCHGVDQVAVAVHSDPGVHFIQSADSQGGNDTTSVASGAAWYIQRTAGAVPRPSWRCSLAAPRTNHTIAFRNKTGGIIPPYIDDSSIPVSLVAGHHFSTLNGISFPAALNVANIGPVGSVKTTVFDAAAAVADFGINPYSSALSSTPATTAATSVSGFQVNFDTPVDLTNKFFVGYAIAANPRQASFDHGSVSEGGTYVVFKSNAAVNTNYVSYPVLARDAKTNTVGRGIFSVNSNQTTTAFGPNVFGSYAPRFTSNVLFLSNNPTATITLYTSDWIAAEKIVVAGGTTSSPVDSEGVAQIGNSFRTPTVALDGSAGLVTYLPLQIGGGDPVIFDIDGGALQFPRIYNPSTKDINFHALKNTIGIEYAANVGDSISHTNSVISSESSYYWRISANASPSATWDFKGLTIVNANVLLRNVTTFDTMTFSECEYINSSNCIIVDSVFSKVVANSLIVDANTSITGSVFDTTTIGPNVGLVSLNATTGMPIENSTFTGSTSSGHAIVITQPGTYSFLNLTFNGYGGVVGTNFTSNSGSNAAAVFNNSGGPVIIQSSGGSLPSIRNSSNATTNVEVSASITITGLEANSEVRAYLGEVSDPANAIAIAGVELTSGSYTFTQSYSGSNGYIQVFNINYLPVLLPRTFTSTDETITVQQIFDRQYQNN